MANKNRKSTRHFNIEKPETRHFDIEKDVVVISEPVVGGTSDTNSSESVIGASESGNKNRGSSKKWLVAVVVGLLVLGGAGYYFMSCDEAAEQAKTDETTFVASDENTTDESNVADSSKDNEGYASLADEKSDTKQENMAGNENVTPQPTNDEKSEIMHTNAVNSNAASGSTKGAVSMNTDNTSHSVTGSNVLSEHASIDENARRVIRGDFGNGQERKDKLGSAYPEIQSKVNEMYRNGLVEDK